MYSNDEIVAMIAVLAKRIKKLEKPNETTMWKPVKDYLLELLKEAQKMN